MTKDKVRSIFIIGAQCTGKTTLVKALQEHLAKHTDNSANASPAIISEVARAVLKQLNITREEIAGSPERCLLLQKAILEAQFEAESRLADRGVWYISDRSAVDPVVYTKLFVSEMAASSLTASRQWNALERNMKSGVVFLCESGCSWLVDDGTRLMPKDDADWARVDVAFRGLREERRIRYVLVPKDLAVAERVDLVIKECSDLKLRRAWSCQEG